MLLDSALPILVDWDPYLSVDPGLLQTKLTRLDHYALEKMVPELDTGFSLPVFIKEIGELKMLWRDAVELLTQLPRRIIKLFRKPLKELSNSWLSAIFGWLPFVKDVQTIVHKLLNVSKDVDNYLKNANKRQTLHFRKKLSPLTFRDESWFENEGFISVFTDEGEFSIGAGSFGLLEFSTKVVREIERLTYFATMDFQYNIPILHDISRYQAGLRGLCENFGVKFDPADIWAVIPFSFVIDWFTGIGPWLGQFDIDLLPRQVVIHDFCRSLRYDMTQTTEIKDLVMFCRPGSIINEASSWSVLSPSFGSTSCEVKSYHRMAGLPLPPADLLPGFKTPKGLQWVTGAALAAQRY